MLFKKKLENLMVEEQAEVKLEVELSRPSAEVRWMKNSVVLQSGGNLEIRVEGAKQTLVFKSVVYADRGFYSCETLDDKTQAKLTVESKRVLHRVELTSQVGKDMIVTTKDVLESSQSLRDLYTKTCPVNKSFTSRSRAHIKTQTLYVLKLFLSPPLHPILQ